MSAKQIYAALQAELPGLSDTQIGLQVQQAHSTVSKLRLGKVLGIQAARWLVARDSKYQPLLDDALDKQLEGRKRAIKKRWVETPKGVDLKSLPKHLHAMVGYVG